MSDEPADNPYLIDIDHWDNERTVMPAALAGVWADTEEGSIWVTLAAGEVALEHPITPQMLRDLDRHLASRRRRLRKQRINVAWPVGVAVGLVSGSGAYFLLTAMKAVTG